MGVQWCCQSVFLLVSLQNHTIALLILTVQLSVPPLSCSQKEAGRSFWLCHKVFEGKIQIPVPMNSPKKSCGAKKGKKPGLVCCECISWAAALRCASVFAGFCRREGGVGPDRGYWVLKPAKNTSQKRLKINLTCIIAMHVLLIWNNEVWGCFQLLEGCCVADQRAVEAAIRQIKVHNPVIFRTTWNKQSLLKPKLKQRNIVTEPW